MATDKISILAVDDDANIQGILERRLTRAGYHYVTAYSADQAAQLLQGEAFALVLLDIRMPGKSGMQFLPEIIAQYPHTGVVMMTGVTDPYPAVKAMREGALDYVTKPFNLDELGIRVEHALAQRAPSLQNRAGPGLPGEPGMHGGEPRGATGTAGTGADGAEPISVDELRQQIQKSR
jgi:DNA-binding NtrC family response regulator